MKRWLATLLQKGGEAMGNRRRRQLLRVALCFIVILAIALYLAPKAC